MPAEPDPPPPEVPEVPEVPLVPVDPDPELSIKTVTSLKAPTEVVTPDPEKLILLTCVVIKSSWFSIFKGIKPGRDILLLSGICYKY